MLVPPAITPLVKGREQSDSGVQGLTRASDSDSNPNNRRAPSTPQRFSEGEEEKPRETLTSRLIDQSPISFETQAALLALLSEPFAASEGGDSFAQLVEEATIEHTQEPPTPDEAAPDDEPKT